MGMMLRFFASMNRGGGDISMEIFDNIKYIWKEI